MSFFTALLGGFGGYKAGQMQGTQDRIAVQQQQADLQMRQHQSAMQDAMFKEQARQQLADTGTDPNTATWDPNTMSWTGGKPYTMPKGWEQVPTDPRQQLQHYSNLMNLFMQQDRPEMADWASKGYAGALQAMDEQTKLAGEMYLEGYKQQGAESLERERLGGQLGIAEFTQGQENYREGLTLQDRDKNTAAITQRDLVMKMYGIDGDFINAGGSPVAGIKTLQAQQAKNDDWVHSQIGALNNQDAIWQRSSGGGGGSGGLDVAGAPNPYMGSFGRILNNALGVIRAHPEKLDAYLQKVQQLAVNGQGGNFGTPDNMTGLSGPQASLMTQALTDAANTSKGLTAAAQVRQLQLRGLGMMGMSGIGLPGYSDMVLPGGSDDASNPQMSSKMQSLRDLWIQAGGDPRYATIMAHVAMAESGGNSDSNRSGRTSYQENGRTYYPQGLWQISTIHGKGNMFDPLTNAREAVALFNAQGLEPWEASRVQGGGGGWGQYLASSGIGG